MLDTCPWSTARTKLSLQLLHTTAIPPYFSLASRGFFIMSSSPFYDRRLTTTPHPLKDLTHKVGKSPLSWSIGIQVEFSSASLLHFINSSTKGWFLTFLILLSKIRSGSTCMAPCASVEGSVAVTVSIGLMCFYKEETWKTGCTDAPFGSSN